MNPSLVLSNLLDSASLEDLRKKGCLVVALTMDRGLGSAIDALNQALDQSPPTSLSKAKDTWLQKAQQLAVVLSQQAEDNGVSIEWEDIPQSLSQILVASDPIIPIDLLPCGESLLGAEISVAHIVAEKEKVFADIVSALDEDYVSLRRIAHVCSYYPGETSLYDVDVVSATLRLDNRLAIEHHFYPESDVATGLFARRDIDILHIECHGIPTALQIDNPYGVPVDVRQLYTESGPKVLFFLGCSVGRSLDGVAPSFVKSGAWASVGAYCAFRSGGESGEVSLSIYYDELYQGIANGKPLGDAVRAARRAAFPDRVYYCSWFLFGNPNIRFSMKPFGGARRMRRLWT